MTVHTPQGEHTRAPPQINGNRYATSTTYEASFVVGAIHTLALSGINAHPFHLHVNSFQLATDPADTNGDYFKQGDWHDVLLLPDNAMDVVFQTDYYTGKQVIHCHILEHEDEGMMLVTQVTGAEGTLLAAAPTIDAACTATTFGTAVAAASPPPPPPLPPPPSPSPPPPSPGTTAITTDVTGAALEHPTILSSTASAWSVELNMSIYTYTGPDVVQQTRSYNGELVGPTVSS